MERSDTPSPASPPSNTSCRKWLASGTGRWLARIVVAAILYTLAGFFLVPALIKWQLGKQLPSATHRNAGVREVKFNPYALALTVNGLSLTETNGDPFASWEQFHVNFQASSLFRWAWTFREIRLVEPRFNAVLGKDGRFNFANLMAGTNAAPKPTKQVASAGMPRVIIYSLSVSNGRIGFADLTLKTPFRTAYEPINFLVENFTTKPDQESPYAFAAASDSGRSIAWSGSVGANPAASAGKLSVTGIDLSRHAPYLEAKTTAKVTGGKMDVAGDYRFALGSNGMDLVVSNLAVTTTGLELKDPETNEVVFALQQYALRGGILNFRERRFHIESFRIDEPSAVLRRRADGSINLLSLLIKSPASTNASTNVVVVAGTNAPAPWLFSLADLRVDRGAIVVEDLAIPGGFRTTLSPVSARVQSYTTAVGSNAQVQAEIVTEVGEKIALEASACLAPLRASGLAQLMDIDLPKYLAYAKPFFAGRLPSGKLDVSLPFEHSLISSNEHQVTLSNGVVRLRDVEVQSGDGAEKWVQAPLLALEGINVNLHEQTAEVGTVMSTNVQILARLETNGALNLLSLLVATNKSVRTNAERPVASAEEPKPAALTNQPAWRATVQEVALGNWAIKLEDRTLAKPASAEIDQLSLTLRGAQFPSNAPIATEFSARVNRGGTVGAHGTVRPYSAEVETDVAVAGLELRPFQPWLDPLARLTVVSGALNSTGKFTLAGTNSPGPRIRFAGGLALTNFLATDQVLSKEFVRWKEIEISGADVQLKPDQVEVQRVRVNGLRTTLIIGPDKKPNFASIAHERPTNAAVAAVSAPAPASTNAAMPLRLAELKLEDNSFIFQDQSIQPPALFDLKEFGGVIRGLSTAPGSTADVDLSGRVDESAPFAVRGTVNPLSKDLWLDLQITNQNLQLTPFTPYMEKFAGYPLNKGRLSLDLGYAIKEGHLKAHNVVRIDHLTLGQRNNSPEATKLPVKLGVALLKDSNGRIELDVPLEGSLKDPEFRVGPVVLKVVMNLIAKAAASPFKLLGGLVGGGGEELSFVEFEPGLAQLRDGETNKLEKLGRALQQRPALNLEIMGSFDPVLDRDALAHAEVRSNAEKLRRDEMSAAGEALDPSAKLEVGPEYDRLLRVLAGREFGTNLSQALLQASTNAPSTNAVARGPAQSPKWHTYITGLFASKAERKKLAQLRKQAREDEVLFKGNPALAAVQPSSLEDLLATRVTISEDSLRQLRLDRARQVQNLLMQSGALTADRLFLVEPKAAADAPAAKGEARVQLTIN